MHTLGGSIDYQAMTNDASGLARRLVNERKKIVQQSRLRLAAEETGSQNDLQSGHRDTNIRKYSIDVLAALLNNLENKAKGYKKTSSTLDKSATKPILASIFLINNYHYIVKSLRANTGLLNVIGKDFEGKVEKKMNEELDTYQQSWKPFIGNLMDTTYIKNGAVSTSLSKAEKQAIKDKFKAFNTDFEDAHKSQTAYIITDADLRQRVVKDVKQLVLPMVQRFWDRYHQSQFTEHPEKYLKYDPATVESMLNAFFDPSVNEK